jgi:hypothetical protein
MPGFTGPKFRRKVVITAVGGTLTSADAESGRRVGRLLHGLDQQ